VPRLACGVRRAACHLRSPGCVALLLVWPWRFPRRSERHHTQDKTPEILLTIHRLAHPGNASLEPSPTLQPLVFHAECARLGNSVSLPLAGLLAWLVAPHLRAFSALRSSRPFPSLPPLLCPAFGHRPAMIRPSTNNMTSKRSKELNNDMTR
jgi:hypothetical protein